MAALGIWVTLIISKRTDKLIQTEDERAKVLIRETQRMIDEGNARVERLIEEGNARVERLIAEIHQRTLEILEGMEKKGRGEAQGTCDK